MLIKRGSTFKRCVDLLTLGGKGVLLEVGHWEWNLQ